MGSTAPRSVRFDARVSARLSSYVARHPGSSASSVTNRLVDEALRMDEHPGVYFCDGQTGRRARLVGGPDVQDVIRAVRATREAEPELDSASVVRLVAANTGVPARLIEVAVRYWSAYPDEIDTWIIQANKFEDEAFAAWQRQQRLLPAR